MTYATLILRGLRHHWRTNIAVILGVATAVTVLAGALLVGDSVRGSLRALVLERLGRTDQIVASSGFFREQLAADLHNDPEFNNAFRGVAPIIMLQGTVSVQGASGRASQVLVYGVDDRFWTFHGLHLLGPADRNAFASPALASEIGADPGDTILVRVQTPSAIPIESVYGRKDDLARTIRLTMRDVLPAARLGEFSLQPRQGDVRAVFVPLRRLQEDLDAAGRVNTLLVVQTEPGEGAVKPLAGFVRRAARLDDVGLKIRSRTGVVIVESDAGVLNEGQAKAAFEALDIRAAAPQRRSPAPGPRSPGPVHVFTYLANTLRAGNREIPYSLVTAIDLTAIAPDVTPAAGAAPPIVLNEWAARELQATRGDVVALDYYLWEETGRLTTRTADFQVAAIVPIGAGDRDLAPAYPGITDSPTLGDWNPPFPIDLARIRPADEAYWDAHRTTPKAFIPLVEGQRLWQSRYGAVTSVRGTTEPGAETGLLQQAAGRLRASIDPLSAGLAVHDVRRDALTASRGATDFGEYFVYFSFFLVIAALLLAALFFKLGIEQRAREVGLLRAVGFREAGVRRLFISEGLLLSIIGSVAGVAGAVGYGLLMVTGLRTWWVDAVGTRALALHVSWASLAMGAVGGLAIAMVCIWWTLRRLGTISERRLLSGDLSQDRVEPDGRTGVWQRQTIAAAACAVMAAALMAGSVAGVVDRTAAFFSAGTLLLVACLAVAGSVLRRPPNRTVKGRGFWPVARLGLRGATYRPGRSVLSMSVIASATFILVSVDAFQKEDAATVDRQSGVGGYAVMIDTLLPVVHDPNSPDGRESLGLASDSSISFEPFRVRPGDDTSCLNLYAPTTPRIIAPRNPFVEAGRFTFAATLAADEAERANPWRLLRRVEPDGAIPVIVDANSMTYVLHRALGDTLVITHGERPITLRIVAALQDSIFQSELLMGEANFRALFPEQQGYQFLLAEAPPDRSQALVSEIESALADFGADARLTTERLAEFHRVENTYLATFRTLGGLGLLIGTIGLGAVLLRNALERRRDLAVLGALGYRPRHIVLLIMSENTLLLVGGLAAGAFCALVAIAPTLAERGGRVPLTTGGGVLLLGILMAGVLSSFVATRLAIHAPLLGSLRSE